MFDYRCKSDTQYQFYSPSCVTVVHDSLPLIPSSASKVHFLIDPKQDPLLKTNNKINQLTISPTEERMANFPPNLTHLMTSLMPEYPYSFPLSLTHLTFYFSFKYSNVPLPPSLTFLK